MGMNIDEINFDLKIPKQYYKKEDIEILKLCLDDNYRTSLLVKNNFSNSQLEMLYECFCDGVDENLLNKIADKNNKHSEDVCYEKQ